MAIFGDINYTDPLEGTLYSYNGTTYDVYLNYTFAVLLSGNNCLQKRLFYSFQDPHRGFSCFLKWPVDAYFK